MAKALDNYSWPSPAPNPGEHLTVDQILPAVAKIQQARYLAQWGAYRASIGLPLPKRRTKHKLRPAPGVLDIAEIEG